jgi:predicted transcriptional regulator
MQNHYRNRIDLIASVLEIANGNEIRQTKIITKANICYNQLKTCLYLLYQYGLIEIHIQQHSQTTYRTTAKGIHFLDIYNTMRDFCQISQPEAISREKKYLFYISATFSYVLSVWSNIPPV